jgi:hypothetical protein
MEEERTNVELTKLLEEGKAVRCPNCDTILTNVNRGCPDCGYSDILKLQRVARRNNLHFSSDGTLDGPNNYNRYMESETKKEVRSTVNNTTTKKKRNFFLILILLLGVCAVTCPNKQSHKETLTEWFNSSSDKGSDLSGALFHAVDLGLFNYVLEMNFTVKNHFFFSSGRLGGEYNVTTIGVLGHVFVIDNK